MSASGIQLTRDSQSSDDSDTQSKSYPKESGYYGMNEKAEDNLQDRHLQLEDNVGEPEEVRAREQADDAAFENATRLPGTSPPNASEDQKSVLQKAYDAVGKVNDEAAKEYLAS